MNVIKKSNSGFQTLPLEGTLLAQRRIFLSDAITMETANGIIQQLLFLETEDPNGDISIYISSPGGDVNAGLMIYDQLKGMTDIPINLYCTGMAASMAAIILAAGQKGRRFILPHSKVMIHSPYIAGNVGGNAEAIQRTADSIMETKKTIVHLLGESTGKSSEEIEMAISFDNTMDAAQAVDFGICDQIIQRI